MTRALPSVYFCGSISGGRADAGLYATLIAGLARHARVLTEHVGDEAAVAADRDLGDRQIHDRDLAWLRQSGAVVAECTTPSLGVGYEIATAAREGKPVLVLFRPAGGRRLSAMIAGAPGIEVVEYSEPEEAVAAALAWLGRALTGPART